MLIYSHFLLGRISRMKISSQKVSSFIGQSTNMEKSHNTDNTHNPSVTLTNVLEHFSLKTLCILIQIIRDYLRSKGSVESPEILHNDIQCLKDEIKLLKNVTMNWKLVCQV